MPINRRNAEPRRNSAWLYPLVAFTIASLTATVLFASAHRSIATGEDEETATPTPTSTPRPDKYQDGQDVLPQSEDATGTTGAPTNLSLQMTSLGNGYYRLDFSWDMALCSSCGSDYHRVGMDSRWLSSRLYNDVSSYTDYSEYLSPGQHSWFVIYRNRSNSQGGNQYTSFYRLFTIAAPTATPTTTATVTVTPSATPAPTSTPTPSPTPNGTATATAPSTASEPAQSNSDESICNYPKLDETLEYLACIYDALIIAGESKNEADIELPYVIYVAFEDSKNVIDFLEQNGLRKGIEYYFTQWEANSITANSVRLSMIGELSALTGVKRLTHASGARLNSASALNSGQSSTETDETACYYPKLDSRLNYLACKYDAWIAAGKPKSEVDIEVPIGITISFVDSKNVIDYLEQNGLRKGIDFYIADWQPNAIYAIYIRWHALGGLAKLPGVERVTYNALPIYDTENDIAGQTSTGSDAAKWHGADEWHRANLNGQGVKVGVIDSDFAGFQSRQGEGNETKRRSRSAANERHARMSVNSRSGKSASMSASDIPDAKYSKTS